MPKAFSEGRPGMVRGFNGGWSLKRLPDDAARFCSDATLLRATPDNTGQHLRDIYAGGDLADKAKPGISR